MSALVPPAKQGRMMGQSQVKRTESVSLEEHVGQAAKDLLTATSPLAESETVKKESHPKGHKVRELSEVWQAMDAAGYLRVTDTTMLMDVWSQPKSVEPISNLSANVVFYQIVAAPHFKVREVTCKMSVDDLMKMLYLNDCLQADIQGNTRLGFDEWIAEMTAAFIKKHGVDDSTNRAKVAQFVIGENPDFTFYPTHLHNCGIFFRKVCYHSYKSKEGEMRTSKIINPSMMKCCAVRGKFEYMLEARFFPLPAEWETVLSK